MRCNPVGFIVAGVMLFASAALFGGYAWLVAFTGALAVVCGACTMVLRSRRREPWSGFTGPRGAPDQVEDGPSDAA